MTLWCTAPSPARHPSAIVLERDRGRGGGGGHGGRKKARARKREIYRERAREIKRERREGGRERVRPDALEVNEHLGVRGMSDKRAQST